MVRSRAAPSSSKVFAPLLFADAFGMTAVDGRGRVRSKALPCPYFGFDAKPPYLGLRLPGGGLYVVDAGLRRVGPGYRPPGGLGPGSPEPVSMGVPLPTAPRALTLELGAARGVERPGPFRATVVSDDGGVAAPGPEGSVWLGRVVWETGERIAHATVRYVPSQGTQRAALPGASSHVLAAFDAAHQQLAWVTLGADGSTTRCTMRALALPARYDEALWFQEDEDRVACVSLTGEPRASIALAEAHRGPGTVFVQHGRPWFVPWHGESIVNLLDDTVIDRALPGDPALRAHVAAVFRRLGALARACNVRVHLAELRVLGRAAPSVQSSVWCDGGDEGTLAHCTMGAAASWALWAPPPGVIGQRATGGSVIAAHPAPVAELLAALAMLDAQGVPLRGSVPHWTTMYGHGDGRAFDDAAALVFARVLVDPEAVVGGQHAAGVRAAGSGFDFAAFQAARAAMRHTQEGLAAARLARMVVERHSPPGALPVFDQLVQPGRRG